MKSYGRLLRKPDVLARVPISKSSLDRWVAAGLFPTPVKVGPRAIAWLETDISAWEAARYAARRIVDCRDGSPTAQRN